jgi:acetolactate synthase-1/2/3 large subunit
LAQACGCHGEAVADAAEVRGALQRALDANRAGRPAVVDFTVARERLPHTREFYAIFSQPKAAAARR